MRYPRALPFGLTPKRLLTVANRHTEGGIPEKFGQERARGDDPLTSDLEERRSANVSYARTYLV